MTKHLNLRSNIALGLVFVFLANCVGPIPSARADEFVLPAPGQMVSLSPAYSPAVLKGIKLDPKDPFKFHFYVDTGDSVIARSRSDEAIFLKQESSKLIKYFLASLTIPEKDLWVNLSPYEKDRIVPQEFGQTEMGRDLLAEDYLLKQITASLIYPESKLGKEFWAKVYAQAQAKYGTTNIPINTFNKVWIVPDKAVVYENNGTAFVLENHLKVMLEEDYLSLSHHQQNQSHTIASQIIRQIIIPELTKEVNSGKNFAQLRQVFYSLILAAWYKKKIKDSILNKIYADRNKIIGVKYSKSVILKNNPVILSEAKDLKTSYESQNDVEAIYQQYLKAFKKGVFNYIKDADTPEGASVPRKYFSGGVNAQLIDPLIQYEGLRQVTPAQLSDLAQTSLVDVQGDFAMLHQTPNPLADRAMNTIQLKSGREVSRKLFDDVFDWLDHYNHFKEPELIKSIYNAAVNTYLPEKMRDLFKAKGYTDADGNIMQDVREIIESVIRKKESGGSVEFRPFYPIPPPVSVMQVIVDVLRGGTAFVVGEDANSYYLLTNAHGLKVSIKSILGRLNKFVIRKFDIEIIFNRKIVQAKLVVSDPKKDMAVLKVPKMGIPNAKLARFKRQSGIVPNSYFYGAEVNWGFVINRSLNTYHGWSGGPVIDNEGNVVGLGTSMSSDSRYDDSETGTLSGRIPSSRVIDFLIDQKIPGVRIADSAQSSTPHTDMAMAAGVYDIETARSMVQKVFNLGRDEVQPIGDPEAGSKFAFLVRGMVVRFYKHGRPAESEADIVKSVHNDYLAPRVVDVPGYPMDIMEYMETLWSTYPELSRFPFKSGVALSAKFLAYKLLFTKALISNPLLRYIESGSADKLFDNVGMAIRTVGDGSRRVFILPIDMEGYLGFMIKEHNDQFQDMITSAKPAGIDYNTFKDIFLFIKGRVPTALEEDHFDPEILLSRMVHVPLQTPAPEMIMADAAMKTEVAGLRIQQTEEQIRQLLGEYLDGSEQELFQSRGFAFLLQKISFKRKMALFVRRFNNINIIFKGEDSKYYQTSLSKILTEVFGNAYDAICSWYDKRTGVETPQDLNGKIKFKMIIKDNKLEITVLDNGLGIYAANSEQKLNRPFRYTGGWGLGKYLSESVIKDSGGDYQLNLAYQDKSPATGKEWTSLEINIPLESIRINRAQSTKIADGAMSADRDGELNFQGMWRVPNINVNWVIGTSLKKKASFNIEKNLNVNGYVTIPDFFEVSGDFPLEFWKWHLNAILFELTRNAKEGQGGFDKLTGKVKNIEVHVYKVEAKNLIIEVKDDGQGIPEAVINKLPKQSSGKSSNTTKSWLSRLLRQGGGGGGLIAVRDRAKELGGTVVIETKVKINGQGESGTTVRVILPISDGAMNVPEQKRLANGPGGIDLNPAQMSLQVKKEGEDFKFDFNGTEINAAQITGASFTIRTMTSVKELSEVLGLKI